MSKNRSRTKDTEYDKRRQLPWQLLLSQASSSYTVPVHCHGTSYLHSYEKMRSSVIVYSLLVLYM